MASIRHTVEQAVRFGGARESGPRGAMIEALILLRHMARPETLRRAYSELRRQGIEPWRGPAD